MYNDVAVLFILFILLDICTIFLIFKELQRYIDQHYKNYSCPKNFKIDYDFGLVIIACIIINIFFVVFL